MGRMTTLPVNLPSSSGGGSGFEPQGPAVIVADGPYPLTVDLRDVEPGASAFVVLVRDAAPGEAIDNILFPRVPWVGPMVFELFSQTGVGAASGGVGPVVPIAANDFDMPLQEVIQKLECWQLDVASGTWSVRRNPAESQLNNKSAVVPEAGWGDMDWVTLKVGNLIKVEGFAVAAPAGADEGTVIGTIQVATGGTLLTPTGPVTGFVTDGTGFVPVVADSDGTLTLGADIAEGAMVSPVAVSWLYRNR